MDRDVLHIRPMTADDLPSAQGLLAQLGYDLPKGELKRRFTAVTGAPDHVLLVARIDGRAVGLLHAYARPALEKPPEAVVQALVVERIRRQAGIGSRLMEAGERWAVDRGFTSMVLASQVARADAQAFYGKRGYQRVATSHVMRKQIGP